MADGKLQVEWYYLLKDNLFLRVEYDAVSGGARATEYTPENLQSEVEKMALIAQSAAEARATYLKYLRGGMPDEEALRRAAERTASPRDAGELFVQTVEPGEEPC